VPLARVSLVLRQLVAEGVSLRNLRDILQALVQHAETEKDDDALVQRVRNALGRQITARLRGNQPELPIWTLATGLQDRLTQGLRTVGSTQVFAPDPELVRALQQAIAQQLGANASAALLVTQDLRRHVRRLLAPSQPMLAVLAPSELDPAERIRMAGTVELHG
jgi:flagellar biosynthesis component FlhA